MEIKIIRTDETITVESPYHVDFVARIKKLGGKYDSGTKRWTVNRRYENKVIEILKDVYGYTEGVTLPACTIQIDVDNADKRGGEIEIKGIPIAKRFSRDSAVKLFENVAIIKGGFPGSGGSAAHPALSCHPGTILEVVNFPMFDDLKDYNWIKIIDQKEHAAQALLQEKERLLQRLDEIERLLKE